MDIKGIYTPSPERYDDSETLYRRCGHSGVMLPKVSLGFWHNFGAVDSYERSRAITHYAFDHGITHFDLANNYGPPYGTAEETMGRLISAPIVTNFSSHRKPAMTCGRALTATGEAVSTSWPASTRVYDVCG